MPGRVFRRGNIYWIALYSKGNEYRTSAKTERKRKAEKLRAFYLSQVARGEFQGFQPGKILTLNDLLTLALDEAEVKALRDVYHMRFRAEHLKRRASFPSYGRMTQFLPTKHRRMTEKMR